MIKYQLDYDKSKKVYEDFKSEVKIKKCYNNIFNILTLNNATFREGKWKVAYGYTEVMPLVYCRHCFILDENDKVIDLLYNHKLNLKISWYLKSLIYI